MNQIFATAAISASGLSAERTRMEVVAQNIANANTTRTPQGGPYRRQDVVFSTALADQLGDTPGLAGVRVVGITNDNSPLPQVYNPGHPDADANGYVVMPNVQLPMEMVNLMTANRGYEANLKVLQAFRQQAEQSLILVRG